jgi:hypothetical protein
MRRSAACFVATRAMRRSLRLVRLPTGQTVRPMRYLEPLDAFAGRRGPERVDQRADLGGGVLGPEGEREDRDEI